MQNSEQGEKQLLYRRAFGNADCDDMRGELRARFAERYGGTSAVATKGLPVDAFMCTGPSQAGDGYRGVRPGVQIRVSERGTLAPAHLVATTATVTAPDRRVSAIIRAGRTPPACNH